MHRSLKRALFQEPTSGYFHFPLDSIKAFSFGELSHSWFHDLLRVTDKPGVSGCTHSNGFDDLQANTPGRVSNIRHPDLRVGRSTGL